MQPEEDVEWPDVVEHQLGSRSADTRFERSQHIVDTDAVAGEGIAVGMRDDLSLAALRRSQLYLPRAILLFVAVTLGSEFVLVRFVFRCRVILAATARARRNEQGHYDKLCKAPGPARLRVSFAGSCGVRITVQGALRLAAIRTSLHTVKALRPILLLLSLLSLPLSGLAALGADCSEMAATASAGMTGHAAHMADSADPGDGDGSCPCCDGCAAACSTGCGNAVSASLVSNPDFAENAYRPPGGARYVPDPAPPVLKRPPILPC